MSVARRLYESAARQAREPAIYAVMGAPDTVEGRFEMITLHAILLIERLKAGARGGGDLAQAVFDVYVSDLDGALREMGVGDLAMGKRMRKLGAAFYGRARAYAAALGGLPDHALLRDLIGRTVLDGAGEEACVALAAYVAGCHNSLAGEETASLMAGIARWPSA